MSEKAYMRWFWAMFTALLVTYFLVIASVIARYG